MAKGRKTGGRKRGSRNKATRDLKELAQKHGTTAIAELARLALSAESEAVRGDGHQGVVRSGVWKGGNKWRRVALNLMNSMNRPPEAIWCDGIPEDRRLPVGPTATMTVRVAHSAL
jgi:hypothetical protein